MTIPLSFYIIYKKLIKYYGSKMQKIFTFLDYTAGLLIAIFCLGQFLQIFGLNIWEFPLNKYAKQELLIAQNSLNYLYDFLAFLGIILLCKQKYLFLQKIEMILWIILFLLTPYLLHQITSIEQIYIVDKIENSGENHD